MKVTLGFGRWFGRWDLYLELSGFFVYFHLDHILVNGGFLVGKVPGAYLRFFFSVKQHIVF